MTTRAEAPLPAPTASLAGAQDPSGPLVNPRYRYLRPCTKSRTCAHCHETFLSSRVDTAFCSSACRQARYRARKAG
jgi:hypothetical protein